MKKIFALGLWLLFICFRVAATHLPDHITFQAPAMNIEGTANSIVSKVDKALQLTDVQKPKLLNIVTTFLRQKADLQPVKQNNEKAYNSKLNSMQNGLHTRLKALLTADQYKAFQELKPKSIDDTNVMTHLFY
ncbi:hypothetical protein [Chitinophaga sp. 212800010-3]|uniref:hypothetical protein n=1 Tax=unclassified Chitinophaga TaxID=2619133 RepID=UPI002DE61F15|nr:Peptidylprolyl isomerase [Chitinophaga sp. 212800010-3]